MCSSCFSTFNVAQLRIPCVSHIFPWHRRMFLLFLNFSRGTGAYSSCFSTFYMTQARISCFSTFNLPQARVPPVSQLLTWHSRVFLVFLIFLRGTGAYSSCFSTFPWHRRAYLLFLNFLRGTGAYFSGNQLLTRHRRIFLVFLNF